MTGDTDVRGSLSSQPSGRSSDGGEKINVTVEFTGGLELLFSNVQKHNVVLPAFQPSSPSPSSSSPSSPSSPSPQNQPTRQTTVSNLISHLIANLITDPRKELFVLADPEKEGGYAVRPGILVLVNDADWELEGEDGCVLREGDGVLFVSTLHGG